MAKSQVAATIHAQFRRKYGIPPKGKGPHPPSSYGLPLPPAGHPMAVSFARAALRRAHQATNYRTSDVAKQVRKAKAILAKHNRKNVESATAVACDLRERISARDAYREASQDGSVVKNVVLLRAGPGNSADRHYYTEACIKDAAQSGIFEGAQAYLDHPSTIEEQTRPERSVRDLAGWYDHVEARPYTDPEVGKTVALFADFHPAVGKPDVATLVQTSMEYHKSFPRASFAGLSINARGDGNDEQIEFRGQQWQAVNRIAEVDSVDIVTRAGAGGAIIPLKESNRMKNQDNLQLTIDVESVRGGVKSLLEAAKSAFKERLTEAGATLTPEDDAELDRKLGIVDGGAIDQVLDKATGVADEPDEDEDEEDDEGATLTTPTTPTGVSDDVDDMSEQEAKDALRKERAARKEGEEKARAGEAKMAEARRITARVMADEVLAECNIPETFRPRLRHELMREGHKSKAEMTKVVKDFDLAYIRPRLEGTGVAGFREAASAAAGGNFTFEEN